MKNLSLSLNSLLEDTGKMTKKKKLWSLMEIRLKRAMKQNFDLFDFFFEKKWTKNNVSVLSNQKSEYAFLSINLFYFIFVPFYLDVSNSRIAVHILLILIML